MIQVFQPFYFRYMSNYKPEKRRNTSDIRKAVRQNEELKSRIRHLEEVVHRFTCSKHAHQSGVEVSHEVINHILHRVFNQIEKRRTQQRLRMYQSGYVSKDDEKLFVEEQEAALVPPNNVQEREIGLVKWIPDEYVSSCSRCRQAFTFFRRKHHCRNCGRIFCSACAGLFVRILGYSNPVRVCVECNESLCTANQPTKREERVFKIVSSPSTSLMSGNKTGSPKAKKKRSSATHARTESINFTPHSTFSFFAPFLAPIQSAPNTPTDTRKNLEKNSSLVDLRQPFSLNQSK